MAKPERKRPCKITARTISRSLLGRVLHPGHLHQAWRLRRRGRSRPRTEADPQLALYARLFPAGHLHLGYFDDPDLMPEDMSLSDIERAQADYARLQVELAGDPGLPVLDIGCGMGGTTQVLVESGYTPTALTPDRAQAAHVEATLPDVPVICSKFEAFPLQGHRHKYGTLITAESLQYLKLDEALPRLAEVLHPRGKWVACDFFRLDCQDRQSGHVWDDFTRKLNDHGWHLSYERDITPHVLPTLRYINMFATRFGLPLMDFGINRLIRKRPGLHHLLTGILTQLKTAADENLALTDPAVFAASKRYMLLGIEPNRAKNPA